jgi:pyruvate kinase
MRKTKIVCTLGPAVEDPALIREMILSGMDVARLNFSHNTHEDHRRRIKIIKDLRKELERPVALLLDTKGPEIRLRNFKEGKATVEDGAIFVLTANKVEGDSHIASITYPNLPNQIKSGDVILIDDGKIRLEAEETTETDIRCRVIHGGTLSNHKSINIPHTPLSLPYLSEQDKKDLLFGIEQDVDFIAASFTRCKEDVIALRKFLDYNGGHNIRIIAKIENMEGVDNFDEILLHADGIMVARGDMGVEIKYEKLPGLQKRFIRRCYQSGKMVITATQMLESMITNPTPTRAEISDVANAVFDGTSAVMLSGETAAGNYPLQSIRAMAKIAEQAEEDFCLMQIQQNIRYDTDTSDVTNAVCDAACTTARDIKAKAIIALTKSGQTARRMSKFRPSVPIVAATPLKKTYHQMALSWGVYPVLARYQKTSDELFLHAVDCAKQIDIVENGDTVVIVAGVPLDTTGSTNLLKVDTVGKKH